MNTLKTLIIAVTLVCFSQAANAIEYSNENSNESSNDNTEYSNAYDNGYYSNVHAYVGYWRTHAQHGNGWEKNDDMDRYEVDSWKQCLNDCQSKTECKGIEFQFGMKYGHGEAEIYHMCEVHYDSFRTCVHNSTREGGNTLSTCWVKPTHHEDNNSN